MANSVSPELLNKLEGFFVNSIAEKVLDGVTYIMVFNTEQRLFETYNKIREDVDNLGYDKNTLFRVYQFSNGYVFDMDLSVSIHLAEKIMQENVPEAEGKQYKVNISDNIKQKRKSAMVSLAKHCVSQMDKGITKFDIALYSRNIVPKIIITAKDTKGNDVMLKYKAFSLRHWDIDVVSNELLLPKGIRISKIEPCEILPARNGVRFTIHLAEVI
jgi:hypothetical protein